MRLTPILAIALAVVLSPPLLGQSIHPGGPTDGGTRATCDLPASQHIRNTGGSDGAGLCVFTSIEHTSRWQSLVLAGLQQYMKGLPGGGYPEKVEQILVAFCRANKREIPRYIQHTGGDETVLDLAIKTGRMPCITYAGVDDFYVNEVIAHMVNLVYLDQEKAAILDNNRPGQLIWMTRKQLLDRWRGVDQNGRPLMIRAGRQMMQVGGGWTIIFLDSPPPPYGLKPAELLAKFEKSATGYPVPLDMSDEAVYGLKARACPCGPNCPCGDDCKCGAGCKCGEGRVMYGQCPGGVCSPAGRWGVPPATGPVAQPAVTQTAYPAEYNQAVEHVRGGRKAVLVVGSAPTWFRDQDHTAKVFRSPSFTGAADGVYLCWQEDGFKWQTLPRGASVQDAPAAETKPVEAKPDEPEAKHNHGVDITKLRPGKWFHNGAETTREEALAAVAGDALADDSGRWFLIFVGPAADQSKFLAAVKQLDQATAEKLHVRAYSSADWQVSQFALPQGVSIRKAAVGRVGAEAGRLTGEFTVDNLKRFVTDSFNPPKPMPAPEPPPAPQPQPSPAPEPAPSPTLFGMPMWLLAVLAVAATYLLTRGKK